MQDIAVQFEKHCWIHSVSLFPPQVHVGRSPFLYLSISIYVLVGVIISFVNLFLYVLNGK
ncbi:hypothetical protein [Spiroplasma endosymbiont of Apeira syringaria]|uniref:hypothetical protein n=1 Tax=Spiroplasma endosymbiont of Apeira syringaria TaxID=3066307 RepID=UPI0030D194F7